MTAPTVLHPDDAQVVAILRERGVLDGAMLDRIVAEAAANKGRRIGELLVARGVVGRHELRAIESEIRGGAGAAFDGPSTEIQTGVKRVVGDAAAKADRSQIALDETAYAEGATDTARNSKPGDRDAWSVVAPGRTGWGFRTLSDIPLRGTPEEPERVGAGVTWAMDPATGAARYVIGPEIGSGGMGVVVEAYDRDLCRKVALKVIRDASQKGDVVARFVEEAQATGQIEHPNIVPVYDIGTTPSGQVFYVMKLVRGRTLRQLLAAVKHKIGEARREFGRVRLLSLFQQVCMGIDFAHAKGVVHRDLKPDNIMIGDYGEVLVMDWGLSKLLGREFSPDAITQVQTPRSIALAKGTKDKSGGEHGTLSGTPLYMSPEQARGDSGAIDERSDIYSLGAILYELLTFSQPFQGDDIGEVLDQVLSARVDPPTERAVENGAEPVPEDLALVCLKALEKDKAKRFARAREMHDEIAQFLEGTRVRERNRREAEQRVDAGHRASRRYFSLRRVDARLAAKAARLLREIPSNAPVEAKRVLWRAEDMSRAAGTRAATFLAAADDLFTQALGFEPEHQAARLGAAELYWDRFLSAERAKDTQETIYYESLVKRFGGDEYVARLRGTGTLAIVSAPGPARVFIAPFIEADRRLMAGDMRDLGETPVARMPVEMGSYLVVLSSPRGIVVKVPILIGRSESVSLRVRIPRANDVAGEFVFVPAGIFSAGGDPLAFNAAPASVVMVDDFAIARFPVTCGEYLEFLNDLVKADAARAERHVPRVQPASGSIWKRGADGLYTIPEEDAEGDRWLAEWPVTAVSWEDAAAYADWRSGGPDAGGRKFRLPTPEEWEKAGRGVDGRLFPWGNHFDPTFCHMTNTFPGRPELRAVGTVATDESPYGVRDMAGGIREFCAGWHDEAMGLRAFRGGYWGGSENIARLASRGYRRSYEVVADAGFRLAHDLLPL